MSTESGMVDTNVLVYGLFEASDHRDDCLKLFDDVPAAQGNLYITTQVLTELFSVVTSPRRVTKPRAPLEALQAIEEILAMPGILLLPIPADIVPRWMELVRRHPVKGGEIFDLQLAASMLGNGIRRIYTYNRTHFECFPEIEVLEP